MSGEAIALLDYLQGVINWIMFVSPEKLILVVMIVQTCTPSESSFYPVVVVKWGCKLLGERSDAVQENVKVQICILYSTVRQPSFEFNTIRIDGSSIAFCLLIVFFFFFFISRNPFLPCKS